MTDAPSTYKAKLLVVAGAFLVVVVLGVYFLRDRLRRPGEPLAPPPTGTLAIHDHRDAEGKRHEVLYLNHCAPCHGDQGDGQGAAARFLYPKPRDFRGGKFKLVTTSNRLPSDEDLLMVITRGMPGSAMVPFAHLSEADRQGLAAHVRLLTRKGVESRLRDAALAAGDEVDPEELAKDVERLTAVGQPITLPTFASNPDSIARGKALYLAQCATCHGDTGKGDGAKEQRDDDGTPTRPRDLTRGIFKGGRDNKQLFARIAIGMPGTPMPASPHLPADQIADVVNFVQTFASAEAQAKVEHQRRKLVAKRAATPFGQTIPGDQWSAVPATRITVSPLWWREYAEPDLHVQALHDGQDLAIRLTWQDASRDGRPLRPEDFQDMAAVQLFRGEVEPFLGMGAAAGNAGVDLWLWRADWQEPLASAGQDLDEYPFDTAFYRDRFRGREGEMPDYLTARVAGNPNTLAQGGSAASNLAARGFGSTTFRPKASQLVTATAEWQSGRWTVVLRRPLRVAGDDGLPLAAGQSCVAAFALWDGAASDRNGQKLISIWHELKIE